MPVVNMQRRAAAAGSLRSGAEGKLNVWLSGGRKGEEKV